MNEEILNDAVFAFIRKNRFIEGYIEHEIERLKDMINTEFDCDLEKSGINIHLNALSEKIAEDDDLLLCLFFVIKDGKYHYCNNGCKKHEFKTPDVFIKKYIDQYGNTITLTLKSILSHIVEKISNNIIRFTSEKCAGDYRGEAGKCHLI